MLEILVLGSGLAKSKTDGMEPSAVEGKEKSHKGLTSEFLNEIWGISCVWLDLPALQSFSAIGSHTAAGEIQSSLLCIAAQNTLGDKRD